MNNKFYYLNLNSWINLFLLLWKDMILLISIGEGGKRFSNSPLLNLKALNPLL